MILFAWLLVSLAASCLSSSQAACLLAAWTVPLEDEDAEGMDDVRGAQQPRQWKSFRNVARASSKNWSSVVWEVNSRTVRLVLEIETGCLTPEESVWAARVRWKTQIALMAMGFDGSRAASTFSEMGSFSFGHGHRPSYGGGWSIFVA